jgi:hypothetical protein
MNQAGHEFGVAAADAVVPRAPPQKLMTLSAQIVQSVGSAEVERRVPSTSWSSRVARASPQVRQSPISPPWAIGAPSMRSMS